MTDGLFVCLCFFGGDFLMQATGVSEVTTINYKFAEVQYNTVQ